jgi:hypothetical protein
MSDVITMKCPKCGLSDTRNPVCGISGEDIYIFGDGFDDDGGEIVDKRIQRVQVWCSELGDDGFGDSFPADVEPDHSWDYLQAACSVYCKQIGLEDKIHGEILLIGGRFQDSIAYGDYYIGRFFADCVENLDKAKAGETFGRPLSDWEKD